MIFRNSVLSLALLAVPLRAEEAAWQVAVSAGKEVLLVRADGKIVKTDARVPFRPGARLSPDGKRWLYARWRNKNRDLFTCALDGTDEKRITTHSAADSAANWAPDGKRILFNSERSGKRQVWLREADGKLRQLTEDQHGAWDPRFSPDGKRITFLSITPHRGKGWKADLVVLDGKTSSRTTLLKNAMMPDYAWSPDAKRIAISSAGWLTVIDIANKKVVKNFSFQAIDKRLYAHSGGGLLWRPDGKQLALSIEFAGSRDAPARRSPTGGLEFHFDEMFGDRELFFLPLDGGKVRWVTLPKGARVTPLRWMKVK